MQQAKAKIERVEAVRYIREQAEDIFNHTKDEAPVAAACLRSIFRAIADDIEAGRHVDE